MKTLLPVLVGVTLALASATGTAEETDKNVLKLSIERKSLRDALNEWAQQTGYQLIAEINGDFIAPKVEGSLTAREALERLLKGTPLTYQWMGERLVAVKEKRQVLPAALQSTGAEGKDQAPIRLARLNGDELGRARLAASDPRRVENSEGSPNQRGARHVGSDIAELEEVVVTGTHIRGVAPVGSSVIVIDREEIRASGHGRAQDYLESLPQNFAGSASEDSRTDIGTANDTRGQAIDLRGLGASSTLVLVNGRRQPAGGLEGSFVDISSISTSAIERIEVLADGASALYGSDAIGGVVNFILRKDYDGLETNLRFGTNDGNADEVRASQLVGHDWDSGNLLVGYQFYERDALMAGDTSYGSRNGDYRPLGGDDFRTVGGNPGTIRDPNTFEPAFAIPQGQNGVGLTPAQLIPGQNFSDLVSNRAILSDQTFHSAFLSLSQTISERIEFFADGRFGRREMTTPFGADTELLFVPPENPFYVDAFGTGDFAFVEYDLQRDFGGPSTTESQTDTYTVAAGIEANLSSSWKLRIDASYGREDNDWRWFNIANAERLDAALNDTDPTTAFNAFGDGSNTNPATIASVRDVQFGGGDYDVVSMTATADGSLFDLPAGPVRLAVGADHRDENLNAVLGARAPSTGEVRVFSNSVGELDRQVKAAFGELIVPIFDRSNSADPLLQVSLAGRYEDYSDFGSTLDPKFGLSLRPVDQLRLRASWGTSFRAPRFNELSQNANAPGVVGRIGVPDPTAPSGRSNILQITGADPDLHEETAEIWSAGFDVTPIVGLSVAATYFDIDYKDKIAAGGPSSGARNILLFEREWAEIINRSPTPEQIAELCATPNFLGACAPQIDAIVDTRLRNLGGLHVKGVDFDVRYRSALSIGGLAVGLSGTRMLTYDRAVSSTAPFVDVLDTVDNPLALKARASVRLDRDPWSLSSYINYTGAYRDTVNARNIGSWTTVDASIALTFNSGSLLRGTSLALSAVNLLDKEPPFVNVLAGFDRANANQYGRSIAIELVKQW